MNILDQIQADLDALTEQQIQRSVAALDPPKPGETVIGASGPHFQRLWALAFEYARRSRKLAYDTLYEPAASNSDARDLALAQTRHLDELADAVRDLAWCEVKHNLGPPAWQGGGVGLRAGGTIVSMPETGTGAEVSSATVRLPAALGKLLAAAVRGMTTDDDPDDPPGTSSRKPQ